MLGAGEGGVGRILVAHHQRECDVVGCLVPDRGRAGFHRILDGNDRRQRLVFDLDQFGGISGLQQCLGDDESDTVAHRAHLVGFENRARRTKALRPAHVFGHRRRQRTQLVGLHVRSGQHREYAVGGFGLRGIDAFDARMGVRRHHHDAVRLVWQLDVVDIAAAAGDEAGILDPGHGLTDAELVQASLLRVSSRCTPYRRGAGHRIPSRIIVEPAEFPHAPL